MKYCRPELEYCVSTGSTPIMTPVSGLFRSADPVSATI